MSARAFRDPRQQAFGLRGYACRSRPCRDRGGRDPQETAKTIEDANDQAQNSSTRSTAGWAKTSWGRPKSPVNRREYGPGQHGRRRKRSSPISACSSRPSRSSGYYGNISERQFRGIYRKRDVSRATPGAHMIGLLERRLDAVIYGAKFVPTVFAAPAVHQPWPYPVNGKRVTIPSYRVKVGEVVEVKEKSKQLALVMEAQALAERDVPDYIEVDSSKLTAKLSRFR